MTHRRRPLSPEERELWSRVAASARPIRAIPAKTAEAAPKTPPKKPRPTPADFHIGQTARPLTAAHDLVPALEERLAAQPVRMDRRTHQLMLRGKVKPEARIDLHGMTVAEAHPELIRFILNAQGAGKRMVLVITGKGKVKDDHGPIPQRMGVLRHQLPNWLSQPPLGAAVLQVAPAHLKHGGGGAFYVYLRRG
ncbi:Smr/MutS family protein [Defluviimonas sp. WL0050]|uniref:Smr/MutS family protein n=1 Tax=Albidovulum litorale TaxID=2984134 RepID=A0ABT2ZN77_9RHOB|nr:Smr/MutS family protein [Defluviimonas sp. WL0050]MCV2872585.1 Smr/MutS family protein [Defluviimonas sp. WL0050]